MDIVHHTWHRSPHRILFSSSVSSDAHQSLQRSVGGAYTVLRIILKVLIKVIGTGCDNQVRGILIGITKTGAHAQVTHYLAQYPDTGVPEKY